MMIVLVVALVQAVPAFADYEPPPGPTPGSLTFSGTACPNIPVTITRDGKAVVKTTAKPDGTYSVTFTVPAGTTKDAFKVQAPETCVKPVQVGELPRTGAGTALPLARLGLGLVTAGMLVLMVRRRRLATA
jgi:uncharacterized surface anchored protein